MQNVLMNITAGIVCVMIFELVIGTNFRHILGIGWIFGIVCTLIDLGILSLFVILGLVS